MAPQVERERGTHEPVQAACCTLVRYCNRVSQTHVAALLLREV